jgi:hypothetical protein
MSRVVFCTVQDAAYEVAFFVLLSLLCCAAQGGQVAKGELQYGQRSYSLFHLECCAVLCCVALRRAGKLQEKKYCAVKAVVFFVSLGVLCCAVLRCAGRASCRRRNTAQSKQSFSLFHLECCAVLRCAVLRRAGKLQEKKYCAVKAVVFYV